MQIYSIAVLRRVGLSIRSSCNFNCVTGLTAIVRNYRSSSQLWDKHVERVPRLGESITEGSISSWTKKIGDAIAVDECVVIIETDKVSVEIKSPHAGVLTRKIRDDGDVAVGDELFEIDMVGAVSNSSAPTPAHVGTAQSSGVQTVKPAATSKNLSGSHRKPLIKFVGKRSLVPAKSTESHPPSKVPVTAAVSATAAPKAAPKPVREGSGIDFRSMAGGAWYGRPVLSKEEIEAIESGGASAV